MKFNFGGKGGDNEMSGGLIGQAVLSKVAVAAG